MQYFNAYTLIISASIIIILSFVFNLISRKTNIPSVLMLLLLGILIHQGAMLAGIRKIDLFPILEVLGIIGLIMIVLEAALDLELTPQKRPLIWKSFFISFLSLGATAFTIAGIYMGLLNTDLLNALIYAIPLSIMSSAIVIPSVANLNACKKDYMIYESTLSDILGIMFFYLLIQSAEASSIGHVSLSIIGNIALTLLVSAIASYGLVYVFHEMKSQLFLLIAVLVLLYSIGKLMHLSSLLIILAFGLILNNRHIFFRGRFKKFINDDALSKVYQQLHLVTIETSFVVRTFFFVIFGMTIALGSLIDLKVIMASALILLFIYGMRWLVLKVFLKKDFMLEWLVAPRGLITILLFYNIPDEFQIAEFDNSILLLVIIVSSILMAIGLINFGKKNSVANNQKSRRKSENKVEPLIVDG